VCWTEQSADGGRHAMARLCATDGHALGHAVAISPPDADVLGAPHAATADGRHAVVTFGSTSGGRSNCAPWRSRMRARRAQKRRRGGEVMISQAHGPIADWARNVKSQWLQWNLA
jgi:hypothetical protein